MYKKKTEVPKLLGGKVIKKGKNGRNVAMRLGREAVEVC